jgi:hypothetical protein
MTELAMNTATAASTIGSQRAVRDTMLTSSILVVL